MTTVKYCTALRGAAVLMQRWNQWECYLQRDLSNHGSKGGNIISNPAPSTETITPPFPPPSFSHFPSKSISSEPPPFFFIPLPFHLAHVYFFHPFFLPSFLSFNLFWFLLRSLGPAISHIPPSTFSFSVTIYLRFVALS